MFWLWFLTFTRIAVGVALARSGKIKRHLSLTSWFSKFYCTVFSVFRAYFFLDPSSILFLKGNVQCSIMPFFLLFVMVKALEFCFDGGGLVSNGIFVYFFNTKEIKILLSLVMLNGFFFLLLFEMVRDMECLFCWGYQMRYWFLKEKEYVYLFYPAFKSIGMAMGMDSFRIGLKPLVVWLIPSSYCPL